MIEELADAFGDGFDLWVDLVRAELSVSQTWTVHSLTRQHWLEDFRAEACCQKLLVQALVAEAEDLGARLELRFEVFGCKLGRVVYDALGQKGLHGRELVLRQLLLEPADYLLPSVLLAAVAAVGVEKHLFGRICEQSEDAIRDSGDGLAAVHQRAIDVEDEHAEVSVNLLELSWKELIRCHLGKVCFGRDDVMFRFFVKFQL